MKHLFGYDFKHPWKKRNIIVTFQSGQLTEQPKTLDDLGRFDLKMFRNCPIRIEIITGSHIFILFLPRAGLYAEYSNMTSFKHFESKSVVKIILIYDRLNL